MYVFHFFLQTETDHMTDVVTHKGGHCLNIED